LRIALSLRSPVPGAVPDRVTRSTVEAVAALLRGAGHTVERRAVVVPTGAAVGGLARWMAGAHDDAAALGIDPADLQARSRTHARIGAAVRRAGLLRPGTADRFRQRMTRIFDEVDLLLTPITNGPPLPARPWHERGFVANVTANARWAPWASPWNLAGLPALVLPGGRRPGGLPVAVQFVGPPGAEGRLLWLAGELERRQPWPRHAPVFDPTHAVTA
jgi:amidase